MAEEEEEAEAEEAGAKAAGEAAATGESGTKSAPRLDNVEERASSADTLFFDSSAGGCVWLGAEDEEKEADETELRADPT